MKSREHPTHHRASTHSSFSSSPGTRQNHMENGPNFTDGKDLHMVGAYRSLMAQTLPNSMNSMPIPLRHHPERARDSFLPSRLLTDKRCSRPRLPCLTSILFVESPWWLRNRPARSRGLSGGCKKRWLRSCSGACRRALDEADDRRRRSRPSRWHTAAWSAAA